MLIKICGIQDPEMAAFAAKNGADLIGFVLSHGFRRSVKMAAAKEIVKATLESGAIPVALFDGAKSDEIKSICQTLGVTLVQAYHLDAKLSNALRQIYINQTEAPIRPGLDFLLMESLQPGHGVRIDLDTFEPPKIRPWFIAGGLTPQNVKETIQKLSPDGVDVSSGVEQNGVKSRELILKFIEQVRSCE
jgi:phosphoribosylanthranilate isomerase